MSEGARPPADRAAAPIRPAPGTEPASELQVDHDHAEWRFRAGDRTSSEAAPKPSETMSMRGIVQEGDPVLRRTAHPFSLPAEADDARRVVSELHSAVRRVAAAHTFGKGMGAAAPQLLRVSLTPLMHRWSSAR